MGMFFLPESFRSLSSLVCVLTLGGVVAGCSTDVTRFGGGPVYTGSTANQQQILGQQQGAVAQSAALAGQQPPLAGQPQLNAAGALPPSQPSFADVASTASGNYSPQAARLPQAPGTIGQLVDQTSTGSIGQMATSPVSSAATYRGWSANGGTAITVLSGDSLSSLSRRYNVPQDVLARVNGMNPNAALQPGQRFTIPVFGATPGALAPAQPGVQPAAATIPANQLTAPVASTQTMAAIPKGRPQRVAAVGTNQNGLNSTTNGTVAPAVAAPQPTARPARSQPRAQSASLAPANPPATPQSSATSFRWPAKGRVIAGFGEPLGSKKNDGINISLPKGASIRAADAGEVIYAGSEIKNFGNLVLLSHAGGYVTAYAHADQIMVNRGDKVSRGQVIAQAGSTGSVSEPQLHFEVRKGSNPVDPAPYLRNE